MRSDKQYLKYLKDNRERLYEFTVGYSCNSNCRFCSISSDCRSLNKNTFEAVADIYRAKKERFKLLGFGGGEPTIRKDIIKLVKLAKNLKFETIRIQTNAIMLSYRAFCEEIVKAGANFFKLSVHGHRAEIHDYLTRIPGSFNMVIKAIDNLRSLGIRVEANIVVNKINYRFLPQYVSFFADKGISSFCIIFPQYTGNMAENVESIGVSIREAVPYIYEALDLFKTLELDKCLVFNIPYCYMQGYEDFVVEKYNMKVVTPRLVVEDGDEDVKAAKVKLKVCQNCKYNSYCSGIWKSYLKFYGEEEFENLKNGQD
jgi:MoaA/NifB/PqqE/SkfB family radical SAM enzyme